MSNISNIKINGRPFYVQKLNAFDALKIFGDLQKEVLPALGGALNSNGADMSNVVAALSEAFNGSELEKWANKLLFNDLISFDDDNGDAVTLKKSNADSAFNDFTEILELLIQVAMENFKDPLVRLLDRTGLGDLNTAKVLASTGKNS
ncbi:phage tail assembly chaperone [Phocoenobacter skyensis]|uniref:Uncharacterized protein n=1 Tax=Phocoenobacter skyensis TaxID=97481 RepID=A0ABT9JID2_9PAST|nr:hypothetical protein [Pasteurella skyensis]MDP8078334.1 hypothetical protein [Pasteurella skyensis]MDP8084574.1 hypothetical protein [Pasteurella skyensis]